MRRKRDGKLMLIDFGAVKEISALTVNSQGQTSVTVPIGSPEYMPSEQAKGRPKLASDVYAVGMIGIQTLIEAKLDQLSEDPNTGEIIWRNRVPQVSDRLADVLTTMVRNHFSQRYQNASEALQELMSTVVYSTPSPDAPTRLPVSSQTQRSPSQPQPRKAYGILSEKKARRSLLLGSTALGLVLMFSAFLLNLKSILAPPDTAPTPLSDSRLEELLVETSRYGSGREKEKLLWQSKPTLISKATGMDYTPLRDLLAAGKWKEADLETTRAMAQAAGREKFEWLRKEDLDKFSCEDLRIIDLLWLESSQGQFGFSLQKEIYQNLGGTREYNEEVWKDFGDHIS